MYCSNVEWCSIIGAVIIVAGLYTVVWGKSKDMTTSSSSTKIPTIEKGKALGGPRVAHCQWHLHPQQQEISKRN